MNEIKRQCYKVIDTITGEILESIYRQPVIEESHERMRNYKELYGKEFYLDYVDEMTYELKEYQLRCPYCTGKMTKEEYEILKMCGQCYDNNVE